MDSNHKILGISCGIFKNEIASLIAEGRIPFPVIFLDSLFHMHPESLHETLSLEVAKALTLYDKVILIYGDCHPYMSDFYDPKSVIRIEGLNCCEIILGREEYRRLRKEGAFFVIEEWAHRWKEVFIQEMGLNEKIAPIFMGDMHRKIVYIDTGTIETPFEILEEMSLYFKLPFEIIKVNLDALCRAILEAYEGVVL
jgi:hypothetical protein